ncbi:MAG: SDR family oxidoreductase [Ideonella sp.]|nr:SDR family oxidoreductase [Ideonella sp.]
MTQSVLITGASAGIGRATAERLAADGYHIINIDRMPPERPLPAERYVEADLGRPDAAAHLFNALAFEHEVTVLINNVATVRPASVEEATLGDLEAVVRLNLGAALVATQAVIGPMKRRGYGRVVNISSRAALGKELRTVYSATKAGLNGMTRTWALELSPFGITVNAVAPGPIETELFKQVNPEDSPRTKAILDAIPVRRLGQPQDIAHAVASLVDARSGFITGQVLNVCGGMSIGAA